MNNAYTIVNLQQGTPEWLEWRSNGIGASDAPTIMDENPWESSTQLLSEKLGTTNNFGGNAAMARGTALEAEARKRYEAISNVREPLNLLGGIDLPPVIGRFISFPRPE